MNTIQRPIKKQASNIGTTIEYKGEAITLVMTDEQAAKIVKTEIKSEFGQKLAAINPANLTTGQRFWLHKLAQQSQQQEKIEITGLYSSLQTMLARAGERLQKPQVRMLGPEKEELKLYPAAQDSNWKGFLFIYLAGQSVGSIDREGKFRPRQNCPDWVAPALERFAAAPIPTAREYGQLTGRCCFCNRRLTDEISVQQGYGPVCAENYGLA